MNPYMDALAPALITIGAGLATLSWMRPDHKVARVLAVGASLPLLVRYLIWRSGTVPHAGWTWDFTIGGLFFFMEALTLLAAALNLFFMSRTRSRTPDVEANKSWLATRRPPLVDVFICTYNEEEAILERTIIGATGIKHPHYRVWVLDDGRRDWLKQLADKLGCRYLTRPNNEGAKAGNINHALRHVAGLCNPPEFIAILDADFVPTPAFLERALPLFKDPSVGIVQTPQHFINPDPIQTNLSVARVWPDEQRLFFDVLMPAKDAWGAAFCCGTSSVIRFDQLMRIGGFPTDSVTEDYLLTLRMKEAGALTVYLNERLTIGLAPQGLKEYITQRSRWCLGFMQIARGRSGPLSLRSRLTFIDRLSLADAFLFWTSVSSTKLFGLFVPGLFLLFGVRAVDADLATLLVYFLPFYFWHSLTMTWLSQGRSMPVMSDVTQYVAAPAILKAVGVGLLSRRAHKFQVTAKGGDRSRGFVEWPLLRFYSIILAFNLAGIVYSFILNPRGTGLAYGGLALAWSWYNAIILLLVCLICIEQPRRRKASRFEVNEPAQISYEGEAAVYRLTDISLSGARFRGDPPARIGQTVTCALRSQIIEARIVRITPDGFAVKFDEKLETRVNLVRNFYASDYVSTFDTVLPASIGKAVFERIFK